MAPETVAPETELEHLRMALDELGVIGAETPAPVADAIIHIEKALEMLTYQSAVVGGLFVNRDSGAVVRVNKVDESYAYIEQINGKGRWAQPISHYNETFAAIHRPARLQDLQLASEEYLPPTNTEAWGDETH